MNLFTKPIKNPMQKLFLLLLFLIPLNTMAQSKYHAINKVSDDLYFMRYDSSQAKSTIVEFEDFIALIELPIKDEGGSARNLKDHSQAAEQVIVSLKYYFPEKPLKYLIHSHWHPHSISSVKPFISKGITLISTKSNFEKMKEFVDSVSITNYGRYIQFVEGDSLIIDDQKNKIVAYRFQQKDFPNTPTSDYLYFYLPKYNFLHCGCMYNKWDGEPIDGKELLTGREEDLNRFLAYKKIKPSYLIRLTNEKIEINNMQPYFSLENVVKNGIRVSDIVQTYLTIDEQILFEKRDSLLKEITSKNIPTSVFNTAVYQCLGKKKLKKALSFAQIQVMLRPSDPNAWDSLGEVYYFLGEKVLAKLYEKQSLLISPSFSGGGEAVWQKDLVEHQKIWEKLN
jgi:hypothetical protein